MKDGRLFRTPEGYEVRARNVYEAARILSAMLDVEATLEVLTPREDEIRRSLTEVTGVQAAQ